ncbi:MAG: 3-hexulose-6-phosphate synthase [candidate division TM6 bacterium GW2011_GWE2_42_60]|nr:MAG: 3-hexulose-6-phosphate synthase [candidate division TM6 bacterium GW2011_GWE2_42_60]HBY06033.1 hypothetical protein [Candidatus Dependentiae bacterium]
MILHISFNQLDLNEALSCAEKVAPFCTAFRIGPVLLAHYGIEAIKKFHEKFPDKELISDTKIIDHEKDMITLLNTAHCNWVTVLANTHTHIIRAACMHAEENNMRVMLDLIGSFGSGQSALDAKSFGVSALVFHFITEAENPESLSERWTFIRDNTDLPIFASTGISRTNIDAIIALNPDGIIIGGAITENSDPTKEAAYFAQRITAAAK